MGRGSRIELQTGAYLAMAAAVLILPLWFLISLVSAAVIHEICHYLALKLAGMEVFRITIGPFGASMETEDMDPGRELLCALAGPVGSLMLVLFYKWIPGIALCGLIQGIFNLLPLYPMDGGRILKCLLEICKIPHKNRILEVMEWTTAFGIMVLGLWLKWSWNLGWGGGMIGVILLLRIICRKIPCKESRFGVQ